MAREIGRGAGGAGDGGSDIAERRGRSVSPFLKPRGKITGERRGRNSHADRPEGAYPDDVSGHTSTSERSPEGR